MTDEQNAGGAGNEKQDHYCLLNQTEVRNLLNNNIYNYYADMFNKEIREGIDVKINFLEYVEKMLKKDLISHYGHFGTRAGIFYGRYLIDLKDVEEYISLYIEYGNEKYDGVKCDEGDNKNHNENMCNIFKKYCEVKSEEYNNYVRIEVFELFNPYYEVRDIIRGLLGIPEYI